MKHKSRLIHIVLIIVLLVFSFAEGAASFAQQLNIPRIDAMPDSPAPYQMRDWKMVAKGYDSLAYDFSATGDYLPLIYFNNSTVNYPGQQSFGLHSYVGTYNTQSGEAITVLPSIVGASLVGIDKSGQNGYNWVKMSREFFNRRPEMNVYKNSPVNDTYDDWWYESMPNVFFYQLYALYPQTEDYDYQFRTVADRFLEVAELSGGSATPWKFADFSYRGWDFENKVPYRQDVQEPEAAGAAGWILYNAYVETGIKKYLAGAEWCMEYLNSLTSNPAYEIQLPYGVYTAARMNAEIGTDYDIPKMLNWCFSKTYLRQWNVILGKWGVYDVNGLIGEDSDRQYAFTMNTFQQIGALVPLVKYDERFARAIGKWVLNAANSLRLVYSKYLDDLKQDSETWSKKYDPASYIAYEALLKSGTGWPMATGDAVKGGWSRTNLSLYSSSSVGYLAAVADTTDVPMILKLDLNKTDFFQKKSFPSYLLYNPFGEGKTVKIKLPSGSFDVYETLSNSFVSRSQADSAAVSIPANSAVVIILTPPGVAVENILNKVLIDGTVIDYNAGAQTGNYPPRIKSLAPADSSLAKGESTKVYCTAADRENGPLSYTWTSSKGSISGSGNVIEFAGVDTGKVVLSVVVEDSQGAKDSASISLTVSEFINTAPKINYLKANPRKLDLGGNAKIFCSAADADGDSLSFSWSARSGTLFGLAPDSVEWTAPASPGNYFIVCTVTDSHGASAADSIQVMVRDFSNYNKGSLAAFYPFNGNANDESGNGNNGVLSGSSFVSDRFGKSASAIRFNGLTDKVLVKNSAGLNFRNGITISFWMKLDQLPAKELYVISHGSWEKRYKVSISNKKLRWTIKTDRSGSQVLDLDSETALSANVLYFCTVAFNGSDAEVWINGELDSFTSWSGKLLQSDVDLTIAQMLPNDANYNFNGVLDDFRIFDYGLLPSEIETLNDIPSAVEPPGRGKIDNGLKLFTNYPNPFNTGTELVFSVNRQSRIKIEIYDILGRKVRTLAEGERQPGVFSVWWNAASDAGAEISSGIYLCVLSNQYESSKLKLILLK